MSVNNPINVAKLKTDIISQINVKAAETQAAVVADGDVTQAQIDAMTTVNGSLDTNVSVINSHTDAALSSIAPLVKLAPDLNYPTTLQSEAGYGYVLGLDTTAAMTTVYSLTGKFAVSLLNLRNLTANDGTNIKLTIDSVVIMDAPTNSTACLLIGNIVTTGKTIMPMLVESSLTLEVQATTDNSITLDYSARAIL